MVKHHDIDFLILEVEKELAALDERRQLLLKRIGELQIQKVSGLQNKEETDQIPSRTVTKKSPEKEKIALFLSLFRGREDVFARRFESARSGKSGYQPSCRNEWKRGLCRKPQIKCADCDKRDFVPVSDDIIQSHLMGRDLTKRSNKDFTIGVYPLLSDETCWFLAVDFDKESWMEDSKIYLETCRSFNVPAALERSRSGNGGHIWIFFTETMPAKLARQLGAFMVTQTMEKRPEIGFESYDRFFPSQDTMPKGGFGNLIALPLQRKPRAKGSSIFVDEEFNPYPDQWAFLASIRRMTRKEVESVVAEATGQGGVLGVKYVDPEDADVDPWQLLPSGRRPEIRIDIPLPEKVELYITTKVVAHNNGLCYSLDYESTIHIRRRNYDTCASR